MNLAPRAEVEIPSGTPANVDPTTYTVTYPCCKYSKTNYVPFLTSSKRGSIVPKLYTDAIYDPPTIRSKIKYGNSIRFTAPRVTIDINPEPEPLVELERKPYIVNQRLKANPGKLAICRVPFTTGVSAPAIPGREDVCGYDITENDDLVKIPLPDYDDTLGPAYYNVPVGELNFNTWRYQGCRWSKMKGQRSKMSANNNPGVGAYEVKMITCPMHKEDEQFKALMRKCCNVPRYTCQLICQAESEGLPGPGYYEIVDIDKLGKLKHLSPKPRPFIDSKERFVYKATEGPGPQTYLLCDCFKHRKDFSLRKVPFLREALRFPTKEADPSPEPGQYGITEVKCCRYEGPKAPFNSSEPRSLLTITNTNPGPGEYCIPKKGVRCCSQEPKGRTSVFRSTVSRLKRAKIVDEPDPATYSISKPFKRNNDKRSHATGKHVPFGTSARKFTRIYDFAGISAGIDTPSVGVYRLPELSKTSGITIPNATRCPLKAQEKRPGPQTYSFHPLYGEAMYRGKFSYNARLMKEVEHKYKPKAPEKPSTPRRSLEWFDIEECPIAARTN